MREASGKHKSPEKSQLNHLSIRRVIGVGNHDEACVTHVQHVCNTHLACKFAKNFLNCEEFYLLTSSTYTCTDIRAYVCMCIGMYTYIYMHKGRDLSQVQVVPL